MFTLQVPQQVISEFIEDILANFHWNKDCKLLCRQMLESITTVEFRQTTRDRSSTCPELAMSWTLALHNYGISVQGGGEKTPFLRCSGELNNLLLSAVSSASDLPMGPFGCTHILVSSGLKI